MTLAVKMARPMPFSRLIFAIAPLAVVMVLASPRAEGQASDDQIHQELKEQLLQRINADRAAMGLPPVALDQQASAIADRYCQRQIENGTTGHFTIDGQAPYMRYSLAGGNDGLSENAAAWSANYAFTSSMVQGLMQKSEDAMVAEHAPHDGHRRAILDPAATHVGLGLAWQNGELRMTEEFLRRYIDWLRPVPRASSIGERVRIGGRAAAPFQVSAISVHHESLPEPLTQWSANLIESYSLPRKRRDYLPRLGVIVEHSADGSLLARYADYSDGRKGDFTLAEDGSFVFDVPFPDGPGMYTVVVWLRPGITGNAIAASNISIRVDRPSSNRGFASSSR
jgi:uncharacterized protein YkwD